MDAMQTMEELAPAPRRFAGTTNPRLLRVIKALLAGPLTREQVDRVGGASNGPALVAALRARGLEVPCELRTVMDRDGLHVNPGVYRFTEADKRLVLDWVVAGGALYA
jgi:hypothetical protein